MDDIEKRTVRVGDTIVIFCDPMSETMPEGWARVWEVLEEHEDRYVLLVSFMSDKTGRKVTRDYSRYDKMLGKDK